MASSGTAFIPDIGKTCLLAQSLKGYTCAFKQHDDPVDLLFYLMKGSQIRDANVSMPLTRTFMGLNIIIPAF
jgi:hypothetical protein